MGLCFYKKKHYKAFSLSFHHVGHRKKLAIYKPEESLTKTQPCWNFELPAPRTVKNKFLLSQLIRTIVPWQPKLTNTKIFYFNHHINISGVSTITLLNYLCFQERMQNVRLIVQGEKKQIMYLT